MMTPVNDTLAHGDFGDPAFKKYQPILKPHRYLDSQTLVAKPRISSPATDMDVANGGAPKAADCDQGPACIISISPCRHPASPSGCSIRSTVKFPTLAPTCSPTSIGSVTTSLRSTSSFVTVVEGSNVAGVYMDPPPWPGVTMPPQHQQNAADVGGSRTGRERARHMLLPFRPQPAVIAPPRPASAIGSADAAVSISNGGSSIPLSSLLTRPPSLPPHQPQRAVPLTAPTSPTCQLAAAAAAASHDQEQHLPSAAAYHSSDPQGLPLYSTPLPSSFDDYFDSLTPALSFGAEDPSRIAADGAVVDHHTGSTVSPDSRVLGSLDFDRVSQLSTSFSTTTTTARYRYQQQQEKENEEEMMVNSSWYNFYSSIWKDYATPSLCETSLGARSPSCGGAAATKNSCVNGDGVASGRQPLATTTGGRGSSGNDECAVEVKGAPAPDGSYGWWWWRLFSRMPKRFIAPTWWQSIPGLTRARKWVRRWGWQLLLVAALILIGAAVAAIVTSTHGGNNNHSTTSESTESPKLAAVRKCLSLEPSNQEGTTTIEGSQGLSQSCLSALNLVCEAQMRALGLQWSKCTSEEGGSTTTTTTMVIPTMRADGTCVCQQSNVTATT